MGKGFRSLFVTLVVSGIGVGMGCAPASAEPASTAVEYVKVCSLFGDGFHYVPGTDVCVRPATNDARQQTAGGTWRWRTPNSPWTWARNPGDACQGGELIKFGDLSGASLTLNPYGRFETAPAPLDLQPGEYIASVLYKGGFTSTEGNFCMFYYDVHPTLGPLYSFPLGCVDTRRNAHAPATLVFAPDQPVSPPPFDDFFVNPPRLIGANGTQWNTPSAADIQGTLSVWLCVRNVNDPLPPPPPPPTPGTVPGR